MNNDPGKNEIAEPPAPAAPVLSQSKHSAPLRRFFGAQDVSDLDALVFEALEAKENPYKDENLGKRKTLGLFFMNPSLRTRVSTEKAGRNLGMDVQIINAGSDAWALEFDEGAVMNSNRVEHVRDAAPVLGSFFDIIGLRCFPGLIDRDKDYNEQVFNSFAKFSGAPILSLESATRHPLQSLADLITIKEHSAKAGKAKPKVVLTWAPHIKPIPQAVGNSFAEWMIASGADFTITNPEGYDLAPEFTKGAKIEHNQAKALEGADFVYVKNWSSFTDYGKVFEGGREWMLTESHFAKAPDAKVMHCLPLRRNVELSDEILDGPRSLLTELAANRLWAAQAVLRRMLLSL
ncbi:MAG: acetylornithine carbamoyltransferase [Bacteroidota bacterium]